MVPSDIPMGVSGPIKPLVSALFFEITKQVDQDVLEDYLSEYLKVSSLESANPSQFLGKSVSD